MTKLYHSLVGTILGASILIFSGCNDDDSSSSSSTSDVSTAYLVDSNVQGVNYHCGSQTGTTGADGSFNYQNGQSCTFNIGATTFSVAADKLSAGKKITPYDAFPEDDEKVVNLARLLQTMDTDGDPANGIDINTTAHALLQNQIEFGSNFDTQLTAALAGSAYLPIVTPVDALVALTPNVPAPTSYTTFERIAEIDASAIATASGFTNPTDQARYVAQKIAKYFYQNNDIISSYSKADWVLGGGPVSLTALDLNNSINLVNPYILEIPSPDNNKTMIVEVCNKTHAGGAISGDTIAGGEVHGAALPCEIAIYTDTTTGKIYIDILDPVGSFAVFFNDLGANTQLTAMALQVKTEIKLIAYKGLNAGNIAHVKKSTGMGAVFSAAEISALTGQYLTYTYDIDTADSVWTTATNKRAVAQKAAQEMIKAMTINIPASYTSATYEALLESNSVTYEGVTIPPYLTAPATGINGTALGATLVSSTDYTISATGYWRSARFAPLKVPRAVDTATYGFMYTVEACSPTYAKMALSMGGDSRDHATALPCQMSFYIDDSNSLAPKLKIVFLNPEFMFQTLFKDKLAGLSSTDQATLSAMATTVKNDLVNMTRYVMDHNLTWVVPNPAITAN